jgi:putative transposase
MFDGKISIRFLEQKKGFVPLRRRWVVERTFGWMMPWRRLARDYEKRLDVSENMIYVAMSSFLLNRIFQ